MDVHLRQVGLTTKMNYCINKHCLLASDSLYQDVSDRARMQDVDCRDTDLTLVLTNS